MTKSLKFIGIAIGTLFLILLIGTAGSPSSLENETAPKAEKQVQEKAEQPQKQIDPEKLKAEAPKEEQTEQKENLYLVKRVIDGDTIELENGERVRYIGIDTPETIDPRKPVQCFGVEAFNKNRELVEGRMIRLEKDITDKDKYNRLLRYVWVDNTFVNLELAEQGFAYSYSYPPDVKYQDQFTKAQQEAKESKQGLWNFCPVVQDSTATPAVSPAQTGTSVSQENNSGGSCLIKGNISSSDEKIYHLPGCTSYSKTKIDEARGEKWFCAESEALAAGWRKALNCP